MIKKMQKVLLIGPEDNKKSVLKSLQNSGIVEIDEYKGRLFKKNEILADSSKAEHILNIYKNLKKYEANTVEFKSAEFSYGTDDQIIENLASLEKDIQRLSEEETVIKNKIRMLEPWGRFKVSDIAEIKKRGSVNIQFFEAVSKVYAELKFDSPDIIAVIDVNETAAKKYFAVFSKSEISFDNCIEFHPDADLEDLELKLIHNERNRKETVEQIVSYIPVEDRIFRLYLKELNSVNFEKAALSSVDAVEGQVFAFQGWVEKENLEAVQADCRKHQVELFEIEPEKDEKIPTSMINKGPGALGEGLVKFYDTPSYKDWDPSAWVFLSFTVFFAMIMGDGGYGLTLLMLLIFLRLKMKNLKTNAKRFFNLAMILCTATAVYGLAFGSFYSISSKNNAFIGDLVSRISLFHMNPTGSADMKNMMMVSILIGMIHISFSVFLKTLRLIANKKLFIPLANLTWIVIIWAFFFWYGEAPKFGIMPAKTVPGIQPVEHILIIGSGIVFLASGLATGSFNPVKIIFSGLGGLYNGIQFFSDVLSYIRIFALGLSGALIGITFNDMATGIWNALPFAGPVFAILIFIFGHLLNIGLCIMGAVIHGLRLNFLEFYRWSFDGDGRAFKPLKDLLKE
ncbi:MAG: hypothetical protein JW982_03855 [Spirochaetes bacterium]|nr:hypothetical protein [Spirochaetota bacterium]